MPPPSRQRILSPSCFWEMNGTTLSPTMLYITSIPGLYSLTDLKDTPEFWRRKMFCLLVAISPCPLITTEKVCNILIFGKISLLPFPLCSLKRTCCPGLVLLKRWSWSGDVCALFLHCRSSGFSISSILVAAAASELAPEECIPPFPSTVSFSLAFFCCGEVELGSDDRELDCCENRKMWIFSYQQQLYACLSCMITYYDTPNE